MAFALRESHRRKLSESEFHTCSEGHELEGTVAICSKCDCEYIAIFVEPADCLKCQTRNTVQRLTCHAGEQRKKA